MLRHIDQMAMQAGMAAQRLRHGRLLTGEQAQRLSGRLTVFRSTVEAVAGRLTLLALVLTLIVGVYPRFAARPQSASHDERLTAGLSARGGERQGSGSLLSPTTTTSPLPTPAIQQYLSSSANDGLPVQSSAAAARAWSAPGNPAEMQAGTVPSLSATTALTGTGGLAGAQAASTPTTTVSLAGVTAPALSAAPTAPPPVTNNTRRELVVHTVVEGDNLTTIAERYGVSVDTIIWANDKLEEDPDYLQLDQKLTIPPVTGVLHTVQNGETLDALLQKLKGDLKGTMDLAFNGLSEAGTLKAGRQIEIVGGEKPFIPRLVNIGGNLVLINAPTGGGRFIWPAQGMITTWFGNGHAGIDIASATGTPIYAADAGVVVASGYMGGYGLAVRIDHGNGYQTMYGHLSVYYPRVGQNVRRGQAIGQMGNTGNSTGPHLHFEIIYLGGLINPLKYLPQ